MKASDFNLGEKMKRLLVVLTLFGSVAVHADLRCVFYGNTVNNSYNWECSPGSVGSQNLNLPYGGYDTMPVNLVKFTTELVKHGYSLLVSRGDRTGNLKCVFSKP